jgi:ribosomal protein S8
MGSNPVVLIMSVSIINLIMHLNFAFKSKTSIVIHKFNRVSLNFVYILNKVGFFLKVEIKDKLAILYLKPKKLNLQTILKIKLLSKPSKKKYLTVYELKSMCSMYRSGIFILSTEKGFVTHFEALQKNLGGEIICKI